MKHTLYQVDAFSDRLFAGNPAAVMKLDAFFTDKRMQDIAMENNLSETAYVVANPDESGLFDLRWFTPTLEINFCGHATVATAHVLRTEYGLEPPYHFDTQVGRLTVGFNGSRYVLRAPKFEARPTKVTQAMRDAFPVKIEQAFHASDNLFIVFRHAADVHDIKPDMGKVRPLSDHGVAITAQASEDFDCVSRFFVPAQGIDEDPVTGSAHAAIGPYWADRLDQPVIRAYQASQRGGELLITVHEDHVEIAGGAVTYMQGEIEVPE